MGKITLHLGDNRDILKTIEANSIDSIVTDPPYELGFMGKHWDKSGIAYDIAMWSECLRILKPGGHLLAFGGSRTYHRLASAIEDAGFEIRDQIMWLYGSGFPKSHNLPNGQGTALKPASEPIAFARKPFKGTVASNVELYGTGALNINDCRIEFSGEADLKNATWGRGTNIIGGNYVGAVHTDGRNNIEANPAGRWPANVIHDGSDEVINAFPVVQSGKPMGTKSGGKGNVYGHWQAGYPVTGYGDRGSAARFFYSAKADREDRDEGCKHLSSKKGGMNSNTSGQHITRRDEDYTPREVKNNHPTVKPTNLMRYLCRLVTPKGGTALDPFMGSGSTGKAAIFEGFGFIGIELQEEYYQISKARIEHAQRNYSEQLPIF